MRILWLCNMMLPMIAQQFDMEASNKEGWISGLAEVLLTHHAENSIELSVAFPLPDGILKGNDMLLEQELAKYYQAPFVKITVTNRNVILFYDEGTVGKKITIPEGGLSLLEAFADAGGLTESSKSYKIKLIRGNNKNPEVYNFNIRNLEEFKKANFMLEANDIIYVDSRPRYAAKFIKEIQPYITLLTCVTMVYALFHK